MAARLAALIPWARGPAHERAAWKVATFGDPLLQFGPVARSESTVLPLENPEDVQEELRAALKDRKFEAALDVLALQGRDADAVRLARGLVPTMKGRGGGVILTTLRSAPCSRCGTSRSTTRPKPH